MTPIDKQSVQDEIRNGKLFIFKLSQSSVNVGDNSRLTGTRSVLAPSLWSACDTA